MQALRVEFVTPEGPRHEKKLEHIPRKGDMLRFNHGLFYQADTIQWDYRNDEPEVMVFMRRKW